MLTRVFLLLVFSLPCFGIVGNGFVPLFIQTILPFSSLLELPIHLFFRQHLRNSIFASGEVLRSLNLENMATFPLGI